jgi:tetratricopeptide (TPR) repeat protein
MLEPLGVTSAIVELLKTSWAIGIELKKFRSGVAVIDKTLNDLGEEVDALATVLSSMRDTFESITAEHGTGILGAHWSNVAKAIENGNGILRELEEETELIGKQVKLLDQSRKQLRLTLAEDTLAGIRTRLHSLRETLQLSLQAITISNQVEHHATLENICQEIRRLALKINETIGSQQAVARTPQDKANIAEFVDLRECVRSAATLVSSASSALSSRGENAEDRTIVISDFEDCFPVEHNLPMSRWMEATSVSEYEQSQRLPPPQSTFGAITQDDSADSSDSEIDLEDEITTALLEDGKEKLAADQLEDAERVLRKCSLRLDHVTWEQRGRRVMKQFSKHTEVLQSLLFIYRQLEQWAEAQTTLMQKLKVQERMDRETDIQYFTDVVELAKISQRLGDTTQALLHARRALKGFKKLQSDSDVEACLALLIELSRTGDDGDDVEGYVLMLSRMRTDASSLSTEITSRDASRRTNNVQDATGLLAATRPHHGKAKNAVGQLVSDDSSLASGMPSDIAASSVGFSTATDDTKPSSQDTKPSFQVAKHPSQDTKHTVSFPSERDLDNQQTELPPVSASLSTEIIEVSTTQDSSGTDNVLPFFAADSPSTPVAAKPAKKPVKSGKPKYLLRVILQGSEGCGNNTLMK